MRNLLFVVIPFSIMTVPYGWRKPLQTAQNERRLLDESVGDGTASAHQISKYSGNPSAVRGDPGRTLPRFGA
jgi:hypothetical protein